MSHVPDGPRYNVKAVVKQTGIKPDTLRAWERRYGLPAPKRSSGGHRLYSQRDLDTIKWLSVRQQEGLSIKRAVELWRQVEANGRDPLKTATPIARQPMPAHLPEGGTIVHLREQWLEACLTYDEQHAERILAEAFSLYSPEVVALELMQSAVAEVGDLWYRNEITVQQEHFCSSLVIRRLESLVMAAPPPTRPGRILAACPPNENHVISLLLITFLLRRRGWEVVYLGADVPVERMEITVEVTRPQLVILASQQLHTAATLMEMAQVLREQEMPVAYGGLIFNTIPELRARIAGHFLGERLEQVPRLVESLMVAPRPAPEAEPVPDRFGEMEAHFRERRGQIEAQLVQNLIAEGMPVNHLAVANGEMGLNIDAALALGNIAYLGTDIEWVEDLIKNYRLPTESLKTYLRAYRRVAGEQLDERGEPIVAWLGSLVDGPQKETG
jgi:DNA-binding transcriptional MerR regulator/methylmalonyl-CoA mutase cobalamin-binding subunit